MTLPTNPHLGNREWMAAALAGEVFGPGGRFDGWKNDLYCEASKISVSPSQIFASWDEYNRRYVDLDTGEEILKDESPSKKYGVGLLYPDDDAEEAVGEAEDQPAPDAVLEEVSLGVQKSSNDLPEAPPASERKLASGLAKAAQKLGSIPEVKDDLPVTEEEELDGLKLARIRRPRSMGITFSADCSVGGKLKVRVEGGRYQKFEKIRVAKKDGEPGGGEHNWWVRVPVVGEVEIELSDLLTTKRAVKHPVPLVWSETKPLLPIDLSLEILSRDQPNSAGAPDALRRITITLVNRTKCSGRDEEKATLFQSRFVVANTLNSVSFFKPLPSDGSISRDEEEQSLSLLYRDSHVFAVGHGCAGDWVAGEKLDFASAIIAEPIPVYELPPITPNLIDPTTGRALEIPMLPLAEGENNALDSLKRLISLYRNWIEERAGEINGLATYHRAAGIRHLTACRVAAERMASAISLLESDSDVALAFKLTNRAILLQQLAGRSPLRPIRYDRKDKRLVWEKEASSPSMNLPEAGKRSWRPFQIAFLLMSIPALWDGHSPDREIADLIWFPTGGGKTEAYLGASAFALFARRLLDQSDEGTTVLMRYTLRLLTSQQFQRASGLMCAMESIRSEEEELLGTIPFSIGIWVGGSTTPNTREDSVRSLEATKQNGNEDYAHVLLRCPWCASTMGPRKRYFSRGRDNEPGSGYYVCDGVTVEGKGPARTARIHCPDPSCRFHTRLPVSVVDQEIYERPPSLVIGTVDKFAMLAWKPEARALFGLAQDGSRKTSPPGLIIQDELHLITGPLGSMVGLYEGLIEELCTDRRGPRPVKPKLVAATATTRASSRQISDLYARKDTAIFPPPGLTAGDSFFAQYDRDEEGKIKKGRMYLGLLARSYGSSLTVNVRVFSALLSAAARLPDGPERDPWWTLLVFYNSLRELGADLTLFGADIPERLKDIKSRWHPADKRRILYEDGVTELTGRLSNSEVPRALERLERKYGGVPSALDACLASNIIEVGVDVPRLGLMAVSGQPKNTAQYIQATGRVGRESPGLVIMIYANKKPRDLSHYEHFRAYHERLYAAVEPSSVTPFTLPVLERALHGVFIAWARQTLDNASIERPRPLASHSPLDLALQSFAKVYLDRLRFQYKSDNVALLHAEKTFKDVLKRRRNEWVSVDPLAWSNSDLTGDGEQPLMRQYGVACKEAWQVAWETPTSMRGVDAECKGVIVTQVEYDDPTDADEFSSAIDSL